MTYKLPHEVPGLARIPEPVKSRKVRPSAHDPNKFKYHPPADQVFKPGVGALFISYPKPNL